MGREDDRGSGAQYAHDHTHRHFCGRVITGVLPWTVLIIALLQSATLPLLSPSRIAWGKGGGAELTHTSKGERQRCSRRSETHHQVVQDHPDGLPGLAFSAAPQALCFELARGPTDVQSLYRDRLRPHVLSVIFININK